MDYYRLRDSRRWNDESIVIEEKTVSLFRMPIVWSEIIRDLFGKMTF
jgi:hypothetical protein